MSETLIRIEKLSYRYPRTKRWALKDINLEIKKGEFVAVMGENGAGKTTLCQCLNGIIPRSQGGKMKGRVTVAGFDTRETPIAHLAQKVGMVLEDPETQLFTTKISNEIAFGPENLGQPPEKIRQTIKWVLEVVRLQGYEDRPPTALSGGQKQRLAIAAVLAMQPEILVLDEPTSQLDPLGTLEVFAVIRELKERYGMTIVIATHNSEEIAQFADKVCVLKQGSMLAFDRPQVIFKDTQLLRQTWIRPPQVAELASYLQEQGVVLDGFPILLQEARPMVEELLSSRR
ncbi:ATP-binding cassette domain-containing protein [Moorella naiadis]|uniref:energy-coupling factor ABC transporter ATP-binding protein n=1 Tax=Moorella naiadis (nom. illeg.) TaxID=3093670 RepID=UPI003D9CA8CC